MKLNLIVRIKNHIRDGKIKQLNTDKEMKGALGLLAIAAVVWVLKGLN